MIGRIKLIRSPSRAVLARLPRVQTNRRGFATEPSGRTVEEPLARSTSLIESLSENGKAVAVAAGGFTGIGLAVRYLPWFKNTREGIEVAWNWHELSPGELTELAEAWVWQFWIGIAGLYAGATATKVAVQKAVRKQYGSFLAPFKIPFMVLGGVLGANLTTSTARPAAEFVIFAGRFTQFALDGILCDFAGKPRDELAWVRKGVHTYSKSTSSSGEAVPYETRSDNILRDLALVQGNIDEPDKCGPYRHKLLLVRELGRLREQERSVRDMQTDAKAKSKFIEQIQHEKARIKRMCKDLYGVKIGRLYTEIETEAAFKLEDLRAQQLAMARMGSRVSEIQKLDKEKAKLKAQAKLALGVKLGTLTRPSPKWKTVFREVNSATQPL